MSVSQVHQSEYKGPSGTDVLIAMLGAIVFAGVVWGIVFGVFAGISYGLEFFKLAVPEIVSTILRIGSMIVPVLAAVPAAFLSYKFILRLP